MTEKINKGGRPPIILTDEQVAQTEALRIICTKKQTKSSTYAKK